jgi:SAM-dependent methyltransferase
MIMNKTVLSRIKTVVPQFFKDAYRHSHIVSMRRRNARRSIQEVFTDIYLDNRWGGVRGEFCSGTGSEKHQTELYCNYIKDFVINHNVKEVVDLGCGDFRVAERIVSEGIEYTGIDIVSELVTHNSLHFGTSQVRFICRDITQDDLPEGDLCLVRQVFQHLSNTEIAAILPKLSRYSYALVTEHYPAPSRARVPNADKPHGPDTRVVDGSAVYLDQPPFNVPVMLVHEAPVLRPLVATGEALRTYLVWPS